MVILRLKAKRIEEKPLNDLKKIALEDFGIKPPTAMFGQIVVGDTVVVKFELIFDSF
jgi:polyisoprenoid-binding protein YceI